jgi:hypothetical protein
MAPHVWNTIQTYGLEHKIGWWTCDNHQSNDVCLRRLAERLRTELMLKFDSQLRRLHCSGHSINLAIQTFFFASYKGAFNAAMKRAITESSSQKEASQIESALFKSLQNWALKGSKSEGADSNNALQKLHHLATLMRTSSKQADLWRDLCDRCLGIDNETRWNSWNMLIDAAIAEQGNIVTWSMNEKVFNTQWELTEADWHTLYLIQAFLEPFTRVTKAQQEAYATIDQVLVAYDVLLKHVDRQIVSLIYLELESFCPQFMPFFWTYYTDLLVKLTKVPIEWQRSTSTNLFHQIIFKNENHKLYISAEMCRYQLNTYYNTFISKPVYCAAILLHPARRMKYFDAHWSHHSSLRPYNAQRQGELLWAEYKDRELSTQQAQQSQPSAISYQHPISQFDSILAEMDIVDAEEDFSDEFERFIHGKVFRLGEKITPLEW